ncbi:TetR family transcriptional regulator C-terminal domain-containing protein [Afifella sp. IM 167]|uniref:TetR family transcriptional regulator C-terminal domain-containing protein n=1 Tax=Afifella sp. IM 167 TaxID=2033586 RepID=UPI001CCA5EC3|nr:TetR family transcriptional regulator C-terminal domain-containing protein [Afifella sp. IM 167]MBZ8132916.1 TetR family transcriptional regulator [Afifella sp. IM 167]
MLDKGVPAPKPTRIQAAKRAQILKAALAVFSIAGYRAATLDRIAEEAGLSKASLLYYFAGKEAVYVAVLEDTLAFWLEPLAALDPDGDPLEEIGRYITTKLEMSKKRPAASRLFANEILAGAPAIGRFLEGPLKDLVDRQTAVISGWIDEGRLAPVDPRHLLMMIWAVTQHYADFDTQVQAVLGPGAARKRFSVARETVLSVLLEGLKPRG